MIKLSELKCRWRAAGCTWKGFFTWLVLDKWGISYLTIHAIQRTLGQLWFAVSVVFCACLIFPFIVLAAVCAFYIALEFPKNTIIYSIPIAILCLFWYEYRKAHGL